MPVPSRVDAAWEKLRKSVEKKQTPELPLDQYSFRTIAWANFDAKSVIAALRDPRGSYYGYREVLFAGLVAWSIAPTSRRYVKRSMQQAIRRVMAKLEGKRSKGPPIITEFLLRLLRGYYFIEEIYLPTGGMSGFIETPSKASFQILTDKKDDTLKHVLSMVEIFHYLVPLAADGSYYPPSVNKAAHLAGMSGSSVANFWQAHKESVALSYAAKGLNTPQGTLLDLILKNKVTFQKHGAYLEEWLGRARWFSESVLLRCAEPAFGQINLRYLPDVAPIAIPAPNLDEREAAKVRKAFSRRPPSKLEGAG